MPCAGYVRGYVEAAEGGASTARHLADGHSDYPARRRAELVRGYGAAGGRSERALWMEQPSNAVAIRLVMTTIMVMSESLPLAHVKSKFSEIVDRVEHTHDRIVVTRNGRPAAVMISPEELESIEDTLELLSDPVAMREIAEARRAVDEGDYISGDELRARFTT